MSEIGFRLFSSLPVALALAVAPIAAGPLGPSAAYAGSPVSGTATVIDGDTIEVAGQRVRLEGIDAPEMAQMCGNRFFGSWPCGREAQRMLAKLVQGRSVTCEAQGRDKYGRILGVCSAGDREINAEMVRSGLAWAFVKYSTRYVSDEASARDAKAGVWRGEAQPAWEFREKRWAVAEGNAPDGCAIKGNVSANGHIYHMPWSPWYGKVRIETAKGERWFCSEDEATKAGFRPAMQH